MDPSRSGRFEKRGVWSIKLRKSNENEDSEQQCREPKHSNSCPRHGGGYRERERDIDIV